MTAPTPVRAGEDAGREDRELLASLERELGVQGAGAVFRKALAIAREASAEARARQAAYAANDLISRLRSWGENDPDPAFFVGDLLHGVLMDCGAGSEALLAAEARASAAEAEVARLRDERDNASGLAEEWKAKFIDAGLVAESTVSALRKRVARLEEALRSLANQSEGCATGFRTPPTTPAVASISEIFDRHRDLARAALTEGAPTDV